ncbi:MAG: hypothetical protein ISEC1_P1214 [Thiomicrorhabdus sp.]|nr:MAG: hypothetical protein ISEC1_P1214 [Thiomicrorhabdus sp.]
MSSNLYLILLLVSLLALIVTIWLYLNSARRHKKSESELLETKSLLTQFKERVNSLKKYEVIEDASKQATKIILEANETLKNARENYQAKVEDANIKSRKILSEADATLRKADQQYLQKIDDAKTIANEELKAARAKGKSIREKAEENLTEAHNIAGNIEEQAKARAEEIAGEAWEAKKNSEQYVSTVKAMKNIIKGYGDEYLIPNESVLDELAEEYNHKEAGQELKSIRAQIKSMIKNGECADCDYVESHRKSTAIEFVLDAFNGKVDTILSKVRHDNYGKLTQQLEDAFRLVNHNGKAFRDARIKTRYYDLIVQQLKLTVATHELKKIDLEEQRRIKEEMRDEERARREFEKALKQTEKEEKLIQKAMKEAEKRLSTATAEDKLKFEQQLAELQEKLNEAESRGQRALSMAQQTKQGHVYIISNIGSFGDDVFKIGLTRRLEPLDRVKELGDASVPFSFDVHAMIHSEDAPKLEKELHKVFVSNQVNKVNPRKEFFNVALTDIKSKVENLGLNAHWTMKSDASEYRESMQIKQKP